MPATFGVFKIVDHANRTFLVTDEYDIINNYSRCAQLFRTGEHRMPINRRRYEFHELYDC